MRLEATEVSTAKACGLVHVGVGNLDAMLPQILPEAAHLHQAAPGIHARGRKNCDVANALQAAELGAVFQAAHMHLEPVLMKALGGLDHLPLGAGVESHSVRQQANANAPARARYAGFGTVPHP